MPEGGKKTEIPTGFVQRVMDGFGLMVGRAPEWFGPGQPMEPVAPAEVAGRQWEYPNGYNLTIKPRQYEPIGFQELRNLAETHDITRLAIETRKDQLEKLDWNIQMRTPPGESTRPEPTPEVIHAENFFKRPDRRNPWSTWLRMLLEDLFVIDAPTLYVRQNMAGEIHALEIMDGTLIQPLLNEDGRRPEAPDPAFQQILHGLPAVQYTEDELVYMPRNPRPHKVYGYSPVEQIIMLINIALRREVSVLQYYTEGNIPEAIVGTPETWSPDQVQAFQEYWDNILEGDTAARRHAKFVPGTLSMQFTKDPNLKDEYDEWIARVVMYAFSLPPLPFVREQNRATANTAQEAALDEGLGPLMLWVKNMVDYVLEKYFKIPEAEFVWRDARELDPATMAAVNTQYVRAGIKSIDEARLDLGLDPIGLPGPIVFGAGPLGMIYVEDLMDPKVREMMITGQPQPQPGQGMLGGLGAPSGDPVADVLGYSPGGQPSDPVSALLGVTDNPAALAGPGDPLNNLPPEMLEALGIGGLVGQPEADPNMPQLEGPKLDPDIAEALNLGSNTQQPLASAKIDPDLEEVIKPRG